MVEPTQELSLDPVLVGVSDVKGLRHGRCLEFSLVIDSHAENSVHVHVGVGLGRAVPSHYIPRKWAKNPVSHPNEFKHRA